MTEEKKEIYEAYLEWVKIYCNNNFKDGVPEMVNLVVKQMIQYDENKENDIKSETLGDYSVTFETNNGDYPKRIIKKLEPYKNPKYGKVRFL